ncbi:hypothetical protein KAR91_56665 [Candidatus Pacearchaeota archaeon]|nr:hypothetical protein [Candidatus Pacearchaeota archaeon]
MQTTTITCDCCGCEMEEPSELGLTGLLIVPSTVDDVDAAEGLEFEDICHKCAIALDDAINDVMLRRQSLE